MTADQIRVRLRRGTLHRVHCGVYAVGSGRLTAAGRWMAAVKAGGEGSVLAMESAAALLGIGPALLSPVHVITPTHRRNRPGLRFHRHRIGPDETVTWDGIPVTSPLRTIADLPVHRREAAASRAVVLRLVDPAELPRPFFRSEAERRFHRRHRPPEANVVIAGRERDFAWRSRS